jgi:hypothetical protein
MNFNQGAVRPAYAIEESASALVRSVFGWMTLGLFCTGFVSMFILNTPALLVSIISNPVLFFGAIIAEFALVIWLSARIMKMSASKATFLFLAYSALTGLSLTPVIYSYTGASVASAFLTAGSLFAGMALFGYVTKRDLSGMGSFLYMGLFGVIIAAVVNFFMQSNALAFGISVVMVIVFTGLTAYDIQQIKQMGAHVRDGDAKFRHMAILGALRLYLDFINLFLSLLHLMGDRD